MSYKDRFSREARQCMGRINYFYKRTQETTHIGRGDRRRRRMSKKVALNSGALLNEEREREVD